VRASFLNAGGQEIGDNEKERGRKAHEKEASLKLEASTQKKKMFKKRRVDLALGLEQGGKIKVTTSKNPGKGSI